MGRHGAGSYTVVEGCETSGKSTLCVGLSLEFNAVLTRETGGTSIGTHIRDILHDPYNTMLEPITEALLVGADRAQHMAEVVAPHLTSGRNVVSDRSWVSSVVYQALARDKDPSFVYKITELAIGEYMKFDELIVIDLTWEEYIRRQTEKGYTDRFELMGDGFHAKVLENYRTMANDLGAIMIDGTLPKDGVLETAKNAIKKKRGV